MANINDVFDLLDQWRHLPSYQLERRADIFFALYLRDILNAHAKELGFAPMTGPVIPEFPVRVDLVDQGQTNQSVHVDYLVMTESGQAILVELKTDPASRRGRQNDYLRRASERPLGELVGGVLQTYTQTKQKPKYRRLLELMGLAGLIEFEAADPARSRISAGDLPSKVVVIQPEQDVDDEFDVIGFESIADLLDASDDALAGRFAQSLRSWVSTAGG